MRRLPAAALCTLLGAIPTMANTPTLLDRGYHQMYNLEFEAAHLTFQEWEKQYPADPMGPVSDAAAWLFAEFDRLHILQSELFSSDTEFLKAHALHPDPLVKRNFENALDRSRRMADAALAGNPRDANARFATILRLGLHGDYLALIEKRYLQSLGEMKAGRTLAEDLVARDPEFYDAYLAIGIENYLLSLKPAPLRLMLRLSGAQTDRKEGLARLRATAARGRLLAPFAKLLLAVAALRENDRGRARQLLAELTGSFPANPLYPQELARLQ